MMVNFNKKIKDGLVLRYSRLRFFFLFKLKMFAKKLHKI